MRASVAGIDRLTSVADGSTLSEGALLVPLDVAADVVDVVVDVVADVTDDSKSR